jgi:hypothetical protein
MRHSAIAFLTMTVGVWGCHSRSVEDAPHAEPTSIPAHPSLSVSGVSSGASLVPSSRTRVVPTLVVQATDGKNSVVSLVVAELGLQIPLVALQDPRACLGLALGKGRWGVRCTPQFRRLVVELQQEGDQLRVVLWDRDTMTTSERVFSEKPLQLDTSPELLVSAHTAPDGACEAKGAATPLAVPVSLEASHDIGRRNDTLYLSVGTNVLEVANHWAYQKCVPKMDGEAMAVECPEGLRQTHGRFWLTSLPWGQRAVRFVWREAEEFSGAMVLPCQREGRLVLPTGFGGGITNYGFFLPPEAELPFALAVR